MRSSLALFLATLAYLGPLAAHQASRAKSTRIVFAEKSVEVEVYLSISEKDFAYDLRQRFDWDGDGRLSGAEINGLEQYTLEHLTSWPQLEVGGKILEWKFLGAESRGLGDPATSHYPIELRFRAIAAYSGLAGQTVVWLSDHDRRFSQPVASEVALPEGYQAAELHPEELVLSRQPLVAEFRKKGDTLVLLVSEKP